MVKYSCLGVGTKFRVIYDGCFDYGKMDTHALGVGTKFRVIYDECFSLVAFLTIQIITFSKFSISIQNFLHAIRFKTFMRFNTLED